MIPIRMLQHYEYCPHRWWLLQSGGEWHDNAHTVKSELLHARVHSGGKLECRGGVQQLGGVTVYSNKLGIYGKVDLLELRETSSGTAADIIEYKPTTPKTEQNAADRLQVYAQYRCVEELFDGEVRAFVYYADVRKRSLLKFNDDDAEKLQSVIDAVRDLIESGEEPPAVYCDRCSGCSMADTCMPSLRAYDTRKTIMAELA